MANDIMPAIPSGEPTDDQLRWRQEFVKAYWDYQRTRSRVIYLLWEGLQKFPDYVNEVIKELGVTEHTVENWLRVARYIPQEHYHPSLSFSHHVLVAQKSIPLAKRLEYLNWAEKTGANYVALREYIKADRGNIKDWTIIEKEFYKPFADFLVNDLKECAKAIPLGGSKFLDKWGTPDVLGVYKLSELDPIQPTMEIVSAEIKADVDQLITAFGQACAYKLFSHKVYLVVPKGAEQDISRIESLCLRFGIGLIVFDAQNPIKPDFMIRARASKSEPDYFYVNEYLRKLDAESRKKLLY
jgi:hypothetical protein